MCAQQVDPIKLNQTLTATAEALDGLGDRFGQSIVHGNEILADDQPADAPDPPRQPTVSRISATCTPTRRPTCSTVWRTR